MAARTKAFIPVNNSELSFTSPCHHSADEISYLFNLKNYSVT